MTGSRAKELTVDPQVTRWKGPRRQSPAARTGGSTCVALPRTRLLGASSGRPSVRSGCAYGTDGERCATAIALASPPTAMTRRVTRRAVLGQPVYGVPNAQNRDSWFAQPGHPNSGTK